ncbi:MAG: hypothetical protein K2G24_07030 [Muribaculaceae bacterium]|nr:hypothetical protein [Muribaculaceae bacterium]
MEDITDFFVEILNANKTLDVADSEFKRVISDDEELRTKYREWCRENGSSERYGFIDFCKEYLENQESVWESLNDYDEEV